MGKQLSEVGLLKIYLIDFQQELIILIFHRHFGSCLGACFLAPRLEILYTSQINIYLGMCFEIFSQSPKNSVSELGGHMAPPPVVMSCLDTRS